MNTSLQQNFFHLFNLPEQFNIDNHKLDTAYHAIQTQVHPDRYVTSTEAQRRLALQWSILTNEAYSTLKQPLKRANYLCQLQGIDVNNESSVAMPPDFLMQQLNWRETLTEAQEQCDSNALIRLSKIILTEKTKQLTQLEHALDQQHDTVNAAAILRKLMFIEKFAIELSNSLEALKN